MKLFSLHTGPDLEDVSAKFIEGDFVYQVQVRPAAQPMAFSHDPAGATTNPFFDLIAAILFGIIIGAMDSRSKVVVSRVRNKRMNLWKVVQVEFFATDDEADARQLEIVNQWQPHRYAILEPLTRPQLRAARRLPDRSGFMAGLGAYGPVAGLTWPGWVCALVAATIVCGMVAVGAGWIARLF